VSRPDVNGVRRIELQMRSVFRASFELRGLCEFGTFLRGRGADLEPRGTWRGGGHAHHRARILTRQGGETTAGGFTARTGLERHFEYDFIPVSSLLGFVKPTKNRRAIVTIRVSLEPVSGRCIRVGNRVYTESDRADGSRRRRSETAIERAFVLKVSNGSLHERPSALRTSARRTAAVAHPVQPLFGTGRVRVLVRTDRTRGQETRNSRCC